MAVDVNRFMDLKNKVVSNCSKVILGKDEAISLVLCTFICSGHILLEDLPGTGKTMLLRSFAKSVGGDFKRVQFTPDLLPSDLTGINFYNQKVADFEFRPGPLFANIVLADEINRATPRTQSSLLEAMEERQITVDGTTRRLESPFMVMATQNPIESYGTFPLPEAQIDRFFMRLSLGYMSREEEIEVIARTDSKDLLATVDAVITNDDVEFMKKSFHDVKVCDEIKSYIMDIVEKTRTDSKLSCGVSTRGAINLYQASQVWACFNGRDYVQPEDIQFVCPYILAHRIQSGSLGNAKAAEDYLKELISHIEVPLERI